MPWNSGDGFHQKSTDDTKEAKENKSPRKHTSPDASKGHITNPPDNAAQTKEAKNYNTMMEFIKHNNGFFSSREIEDSFHETIERQTGIKFTQDNNNFSSREIEEPFHETIERQLRVYDKRNKPTTQTGEFPISETTQIKGLQGQKEFLQSVDDSFSMIVKDESKSTLTSDTVYKNLYKRIPIRHYIKGETEFYIRISHESKLSDEERKERGIHFIYKDIQFHVPLEVIHLNGQEYLHSKQIVEEMRKNIPDQALELKDISTVFSNVRGGKNRNALKEWNISINR